jgi:ribosomal protein L40E
MILTTGYAMGDAMSAVQVVSSPSWLLILVFVTAVIVTVASLKRRKEQQGLGRWDVRVCRQCGAAQPPHAVYCRACGQRLG